MIIAGILGMSSKFTECTLGQMYRETRPDGRVMGGAMFYLSKGLKEMGAGALRKVPGGGSSPSCASVVRLAGGNAFQVSQSLGAVSETFKFLGEDSYIRGFENNWVDIRRWS